METHNSRPKLNRSKQDRKPIALKAGPTTLLDEDDALARVTWLYHHRRLTQEQIAQQLGVSRPTIQRLLRQAAEKGFITVSLRVDLLRRLQTASRLVERFGLREVFVVPISDLDSEEDIRRACAKTGALYLEATLQPHQILAIAWGQTMFEVARALRETPVEGLVVAQSTGGLNRSGFFNPSRVTSLFGEKLHAQVYHLYVPMIIASKELREVLLPDPGIREVLDLVRQASCFMAGIGKVEKGATVLQTGFLDQGTINRLKASGAVGDISSRYFDLQGKPILGDVNDRLMGLSWEDMRQLQTVVAVAGPNRVEAVVGALRTGLLHVLIIDEQTAQKVLDGFEPGQTRPSQTVSAETIGGGTPLLPADRVGRDDAV